jgi:hypothetical protein
MERSKPWKDAQNRAFQAFGSVPFFLRNSIAGALSPCRKGTTGDEAETRIIASPLDIGALCVREDTSRHQNEKGHTVLSGLQLSAARYELHPRVVDFA